jgi:hypothetical protein
LHPAALYAPDHETSFGSIVAAAADRNESVLGYRVGSAAVVMNPAKSTRVHLGRDDQVLVLGPRAERPAAVEPLSPPEHVVAPKHAAPVDVETAAAG